MKILGIETSCDETALSLIQVSNLNENQPDFEIINSALNSQIELHKDFGGVFPSLAKREHAKNSIPLLLEIFRDKNPAETETKIDPDTHDQIKEILKREADLFENFIKIIPSIKKPDVDLIAVTSGPGLEPALWVGINFARALSLFWKIPMIAVNHMEGHITSVLLDKKNKVDFPAISLLISGGHTELVLIKDWNNYELIGQTKDDAIGEAFDKVARLLGFPYPGGPKISKLAEQAREQKLEIDFAFPRPMLNSPDFDFSFSGLKTAVLYFVQKIENRDEEMNQKIALEFENAVTEVILKKTFKALGKYNCKNLIIGGGVIANNYIRKSFEEKSQKENINLHLPTKELSTDNATMIAIAGYFRSKIKAPEIAPEIIAEGNLEY